jgi:hypothetical protein
VVQRGEWEDLKQRLERLPAGHPSSLDDEDPAAEDWAEDRPAQGRTDEGRTDEGRTDEGRTDEGRTDEDRVDEDRVDRAAGQSAARRGRIGPGRSARLPRGHEAEWGPGPGQREPYRPWFASGDSSDPWFSADSDA